METQGAAGPGKTSVAKRRREQKDRASGRHLLWALSLLQAGAAHHTTPAAVELKRLREQVEAQRLQVEQLSNTVEELTRKLENREPTRTKQNKEHEENDEDMLKMEPEPAEEEPLDGEANSVDESGDGPHQGDRDDDEARELLQQMMPGSVVRVTDEVNLMLEACRRADLDLMLDERRVMAAGKLGRVIKTDADDLTVKVKVLDIGVTWLPVQALQPIRHSTMDAGVPEASSSDDSSNGSTGDEQWDDET